MTLSNIVPTTLETYNMEVFFSRWTRLLSLLITFAVFHYNRYKNQSWWYGYFAREPFMKTSSESYSCRLFRNKQNFRRCLGYQHFISSRDYCNKRNYRFIMRPMHNSLIEIVAVENYTENLKTFYKLENIIYIYIFAWVLYLWSNLFNYRKSELLIIWR